MATVGEEDVEYESDPEEAKLLLTARRREASDDEDEEEEEGTELPPKRIDAAGVSDYESDGVGAAAEYDEDGLEIDENEELEEYDDLEEEQQQQYVEEQYEVEEDKVSEFDKRSVGKIADAKGEIDQQFGANVVGDEIGGGEEKKENDPFAVPTAGAFYMHDDRFRDSTGGRHRRTPGMRKLWESKDDRKWGHDKFEEMTNQQRHYAEGRRASRGRNRGRGKNRAEECGYPQGNRPKTFNNNNQNNVQYHQKHVPNNQNNIPNGQNDAPNRQNNAPNHQNNALSNQLNAPKGVRGRGPRKYQSTWKAYGETPGQNKQFGKSVEKNSYSSATRVSESTGSVEANNAPTRKHVFSSLNSASPPFYPSASSNKEISLTQKRDGLAAPLQRNLPTDDSFLVSQSNTMRGKNVADLMGMNKLYIDDSVSSRTGKAFTNLDLQASGSSLINPSQSLSRGHGRGQTPMGQITYQSNSHNNQSNVPHNQVNRVGTPSQLHQVHRAPAVQTRGQASIQASVQQLGHRSATQSSSPPKSALMSASFDSRELETPREASKSKTALVGNGKGSVQGSGRGSFPYGGTQILGTPGTLNGGHADPNFPTTPTFLPVMQFGGQHPGGMGVPAVGMAFPGYVRNPALGNSEMTWLPVLAGTAGALGASGALGATYCSPYLSVDGAYNARSSSQMSSLLGASSKENNINKPGNEMKPSQRPELANDEYGQRQNKARRYTEMKFDQ